MFERREGDTVVLSVPERPPVGNWLRVALALTLGTALLSAACVRIEPPQLASIAARVQALYRYGPQR